MSNMTEVALTKLSSKGQVVIPSYLRRDFNIGEQLLVIRKRDQVILQRMNNVNEKFKGELKLALRTERALKDYENGKFKEKSAKDFLKEIKEW